MTEYGSGAPAKKPKKRTAVVRYDSSADMHIAWMKAANINMADIAEVWRESLDTLTEQMRDKDAPQLAHKAAVRLLGLYGEMARMHEDLSASKDRRQTIDVGMNPFSPEPTHGD